MRVEDLLKSPNYNSSYNIIVNAFIHEYDIAKANINALLQRGVIDKALYDTLYSADKSIREKRIGLMIRDNQKIYKEIQAGIMDAKRNLITVNNIDTEDIVSIKNDAVFIMNKKPDITKFGLMDFKLKNIYTIYIKINRYEFYYYYNSFNQEEKLDVKGISDNKLVIHKKYFMDFLLALFNTLQVQGIIEAMTMLYNFGDLYVQRKLDVNYYRKFNSESNFDLLYEGAVWSSETISDVRMVDIRYNYEILRDLYGVLSSFYFKKVKE